MSPTPRFTRAPCMRACGNITFGNDQGRGLLCSTCSRQYSITNKRAWTERRRAALYAQPFTVANPAPRPRRRT